ncbi:hypothetical protein BASA62_007996 [Batrachochytrium salamandrivorans]|nr:hypothetical protein BASA62_007996 [Batrachochytrium salamandrivorans]
MWIGTADYTPLHPLIVHYLMPHYFDCELLDAPSFDRAILDASLFDCELLDAPFSDGLLSTSGCFLDSRLDDEAFDELRWFEFFYNPRPFS